MFAIELLDNNTRETKRFFLNRNWALIGESAGSHLQLPGIDFSLLFYQTGGSDFRCQQIITDESGEEKINLDETYPGYAKFAFGNFKVSIISVDNDLLLKPEEALDIAGQRILQTASSGKFAKYPALTISEPVPIMVSFSGDQAVYVGRARDNSIVIDASDVSSHHARFFCDGEKFLVEDLGSTNGTFIDGNQVSGQATFHAGQSVCLGASTIIKGLHRETEVVIEEESLEPETEIIEVIQEEERKFPILLAVSEVARPARLVLPLNKWVTIGRDPDSGFWLGAPYVSRKHCQVQLLADNTVQIQDCSTNGTAYSGGIIKNSGTIDVKGQPEVLHFGSGLAVAICFDQKSESHFLESKGRADAFIRRQERKADALVAAEQAESEVVQIEDSASNFKPVRFGMLQKQKQSKGVLTQYLDSFLALKNKQKVLLVVLFLLGLAFIVVVLMLLTNILK